MQFYKAYFINFHRNVLMQKLHAVKYQLFLKGQEDEK